MVSFGMSNRRIIGSYFFSEAAVSRETYRKMLSTHAILRIRSLERRPIFMHNGAPPHIIGPRNEVSDQNFGKDCIGRGGPFAWPPCPLDLNACDLYLWGHIEYTFYQVSITSREHLNNRIREAIQIINENTLMRVWGNMKNRLDLLVSQSNGHIEHMLQLKKISRSFSIN